ncbi:integral membrane protein GPR155 isoform X2 [Neocloeon triangulifer]|uniref:integral membrane protein GPR155 isoform X2 n=1 Tax=Neocloeon triangulifer TaxID=2078957 RepID=UPI00286F1121|nr:integral membrane protein GPR155 isoform X2 [Neocloeon triangulifer]
MSRMWQANFSDVSPPSPGDIAMENLYPALIECFAIIICGYLAGRFNLISQTEGKGLGTFVGTFALPSLIFLSLAELDLSSVNWKFLLSLLIAKAIVFFGVGLITLLISRPVNLGRAGLFSIFCTQSNDFAIGYPIVAALYQKSHPEFPSYLYLAAPISLVILNPLGFVLMELGKRRESEGQPVGGCRLAAAVIKSIALNPVVLMTGLGMLGNILFHHQLPTCIYGVLKVLGSAFSATALFLLGLRMVGKVHKMQGAALLAPGIMIAVKLLVLPLVVREVVSIIKPGVNETETSDYSTYGFLYGTFPAAPGVFVFATQYNIDVDLIASAMVACTFISAPLMFVSARMITLTKLDPSDYLPELDTFVFRISIAGLVFSIWVLIVFILSKKYKRVPHRFTFCLVISQFLSCTGAILWTVLGQEEGWQSYVQFSIFALGVYGCRLWTAFLAIGLVLMQCRSLCFVLKLQPYFILLGWGIPSVIVTALLLIVKKEVVILGGRDPNFTYGEIQAIVATFLLIVCMLVTVGCLILHQRYRQRYSRYLLLVQDDGGVGNIQDEGDTCEGKASGSDPCASGNGCCSRVVDIEDITVSHAAGPSSSDKIPRRRTTSTLSAGDLCPGEFSCASGGQESCRETVEKYRAAISTATDDEVEELAGNSVCCRNEDEGPEDEAQTLKHVVLLLFLLCSMFVGIALCIWTLVMEKISGIFIELSFLDASLNFGQSIFAFAVFGLDSELIILPFVKRWRRFWFGSEALQLVPWNELSLETRQVCEQFRKHHLENCHRAIARNRRWRLQQFKQAFPGCELVDWLLSVGLAHDRVEALKYGRQLVEGRVLKHVAGHRHFMDGPFFYCFVLKEQ